MLESSGLIGWISAVLLMAAVVAWLKLAKGPLLRRLNGRTTANPDDGENASRLLLISFGVGVLAVVLAIGRWMAM